MSTKILTPWRVKGCDECKDSSWLLMDGTDGLTVWSTIHWLEFELLLMLIEIKVGLTL